MLNYISAELYKLAHRKYLPIFLLTMLGAETALAVMLSWNHQTPSALYFSFVISIATSCLSLGLYLSVGVADMIFSDQYKVCTLKNEVSFGISRVKIYLGKLLPAVLLEVVFCAVLLGFYVGLCALLRPDGVSVAALQTLGNHLLIALPLWLGALGLVHMCFTLLKSNNIACFVFVGFVGVSGGALELLSILQLGMVSQLAEFLLKFQLTTPFSQMPDAFDVVALGEAWAIGLGWLLATTVVGAAIFRKREIS